MHVTLWAALLYFLVWTGVAAFLRIRRRTGWIRLAFLTIFAVYVFKVLDYTLFQFQSLILLRSFYPNLILQGQTDGQSLNLIPLITLTPRDVKTSLLNILLLVPFGFGLPFISRLRTKGIVLAGALFSLAIEFLQLFTGWMAGTTFRIADINDVIFNTLGAAVGAILAVGFLRLCRFATRDREISSHPVVRYMIERPQG